MRYNMASAIALIAAAASEWSFLSAAVRGSLLGVALYGICLLTSALLFLWTAARPEEPRV